MAEHKPRHTPSNVVAFGRRAAVDSVIDPLGWRGWTNESRYPQFVGAVPSDEAATPPRAPEEAYVPHPSGDAPHRPPTEADGPRPLVLSRSELPSLYFVEWHYIDFVISCVGSISKAAEILGIQRSTLQRKRKKIPPTR